MLSSRRVAKGRRQAAKQALFFQLLARGWTAADARCEHRPIAHVAAEAGISRQCLSKWKARFDELGEVGTARPGQRAPVEPDAP